MEPIEKGARIVGEQRAALATALADRYDKGDSIRTLAAASGRSYGTVHRLLGEADVTLRARGGNFRGTAAL